MKIKPIGKKGILGFDTVKLFMISLLALAVTAIAVFLALSTLSNNVLKADSVEKNATADIIGNITVGSTKFFANTGTFFTILGIVVLIMIIAVVILVVQNFQRNENETQSNF